MGSMGARWAAIALAAWLGGCAQSHGPADTGGYDGSAMVVDGGLDGVVDGGGLACAPAPYAIYETTLSRLDAVGERCPGSRLGYSRPREGSWIMLPSCNPTSACDSEMSCALYDSRSVVRWTTVGVIDLSVINGRAVGVLSIEMRARDPNGDEHTICEGEYAYEAHILD